MLLGQWQVREADAVPACVLVCDFAARTRTSSETPRLLVLLEPSALHLLAQGTSHPLPLVGFKKPIRSWHCIRAGGSGEEQPAPLTTRATLSKWYLVPQFPLWDSIDTVGGGTLTAGGPCRV